MERAENAKLFNNRVLTMGSLLKCDDRWVLNCQAQARSLTLAQSPTHQPQFAVHVADAVAVAVAEPVETKDSPNPSHEANEGEKKDQEETQEPYKPQKVKMGKSVVLVPMVAIGTAASIAAAVALFSPDPFSAQGLSGFPFPDLADMALSLPELGPLGAFSCCCITIPDPEATCGPAAECCLDCPGMVVQASQDFKSCAAIGELLDCSQCGDAMNLLGSCQIADACGDIMGATGDCANQLGDCSGQAIDCLGNCNPGECFSGLGDVGEGVDGIFGCVSNLCSECNCLGELLGAL